MVGRRTWVASSVVVALFSAAAFAALMQHSETTVPMPAIGESTPLSKLEYRARFVASIDSVKVDLQSPEGADPVVARWEFLGSNTDGQAHRVEISVRLLDESSSQIGTYSTRSILAPGAKGQKVNVTTKAKADVWSRAKRARIFADWTS